MIPLLSLSSSPSVCRLVAVHKEQMVSTVEGRALTDKLHSLDFNGRWKLQVIPETIETGNKISAN